MTLEERVRGLLDREAAIDAMHRFVGGLDTADADLVRSAFTPDAVVDLRPLNKIGFDFQEELEGRDVLVDALMQGAGAVDTLHHLSNFRVNVTGDSAHLTCYTLAQHFRPGEGPLLKFTEHLLLGNRAEVGLVRSDDDTWCIRRITISCAWSMGDMSVFGH